MDFIEFTLENGEEIFLNFSAIKSLEPSVRGSIVTYETESGLVKKHTLNDYKTTVNRINSMIALSHS
jgi:cold shock CspA family protein